MTIPDPASAGVLNAAAFIFTRLRKLGPVDAMKLQKLLYYANAWSLADRGTPLFTDAIEAWRHGPSVAALHPLFHGAMELDEWPHGNPKSLSPEDRAFINRIVDLYGGLSGWRLRGLSMKERPWIEANREAQAGPERRVALDPVVTADFYRAIRAPDRHNHERATDA